MRTRMQGITVTPDEVVEAMRVYAEAGVEEFMVQWFTTDDIGGLALIAERVLPQLSN